MEKTKIEWCDSTWNPITGCYHTCPYCYARGTASRFKGCDLAPTGETHAKIVVLEEKMTVTNSDGVVRNAAYPFGFVPTFHTYRLDDPVKKGFGKTIFVCSMADMFGEWVPDVWIERVFDACSKAENHRYLFLTKNPSRYIELADKGKLPTGDSYWYGSTATTQDSTVFWSKQHNTFVSIEPILEPFDYAVSELESDSLVHKVDWAIFGAETGNRKNKVVPEKSWVESAVNLFKSSGKPVFMKDSMKPIWGDDIITQLPWD